MKKKDFKKRWQELNSEVYLKRILQCFANGGSIAEYLSPFSLYKGRIDFRGLEITSELRSVCSKILRCYFKHVDLTASNFRDCWTENCVFEDVVFDEANMQGFRDLGNKYLKCSFIETDCSGAGIGHQGSWYDKCVFKNVKYKRVGFVRPEFNNCIFDNCKLTSTDFNASSFESCTFIGKLQRVCFCNGYFLGKQLNEKFGMPRENQMHNVSFAKAELKMIDFRWDCDLSTIVMPESGEYRRYDNFSKRLKTLRNKLNEFRENDQKQIEVFIKVYLQTAIDLNQEMYIFNCDEIRKKYGEDSGQKMIEIMDRAI